MPKYYDSDGEQEGLTDKQLAQRLEKIREANKAETHAERVRLHNEIEPGLGDMLDGEHHKGKKKQHREIRR